MEYIQDLRLSFHDFVKCASQRRRYKGQLRRAFEDKELVTSLVGPKQLLDHADWGHGTYRDELLSLTDSRYFGKWTTAELNKQTDDQTANLNDVIINIKEHAPHMIGLLRFICKPKRQSIAYSRPDSKTRWLTIFAMLCYTLAPRNSDRWATLWGI